MTSWRHIEEERRRRWYHAWYAVAWISWWIVAGIWLLQLRNHHNHWLAFIVFWPYMYCCPFLPRRSS